MDLHVLTSHRQRLSSISVAFPSFQVIRNSNTSPPSSELWSREQTRFYFFFSLHQQGLFGPWHCPIRSPGRKLHDCLPALQAVHRRIPRGRNTVFTFSVHPPDPSIMKTEAAAFLIEPVSSLHSHHRST